MGKTSNATKDKWNSKNYDDIRIRVPKGKKVIVQNAANDANTSVNNYVFTATNKQIDEDRIMNIILNAGRNTLSIPDLVRMSNIPPDDAMYIIETLRKRGVIYYRGNANNGIDVCLMNWRDYLKVPFKNQNDQLVFSILKEKGEMTPIAIAEQLGLSFADVLHSLTTLKDQYKVDFSLNVSPPFQSIKYCITKEARENT